MEAISVSNEAQARHDARLHPGIISALSGRMVPVFYAIVAMSSNRVIGKDGKLPWHLPEDLKFFKEKTLGHTLLMGRKTFDSIGRPLPKRRNIVLSRYKEPVEGLEVIENLDELICADGEEIFVIGGAQVFEMMLPKCEGLYLTWIEQPYEGDVLFPPFEHLYDSPTVIGHGNGIEFRYYPRKA